MNRQDFRAALLSIVALAATSTSGSASSQAPADGVTALLRRFEQVVQNADAAAHQTLLADSADRPRSADFASIELLPGASRVGVQERDRQQVPGTLPYGGYRVMVDGFAGFGG